MSTVNEYRTAVDAVHEGGVIAMAEYDNGHGRTVYKICMNQAMVEDLLTSPYVDQGTVKWHYKDGKWMIPPRDYE